MLGSTTSMETAQYNSFRDGLGAANSAGFSFVTNHSKTTHMGSTFTSPKGKSTSINFSPKVGYFIIDGLLIGIDIPIWRKKEFIEDNSFTLSLLSAGPMVRYYYGKGKFMPFVEGEAVFGQIKEKSVPPYPKTNITNVSGGIGFAVFLTEKVSFEALVGYKYLKAVKVDDPTETVWYTNAIGVAIGFMVLL